ncbi:MAG: hypothetical protein PHV34_19055 [Verrucomicrobiae bacterium]|nr:hypothetical protein [Verrucomicrobiae bacterium]
MKLEATSTNFLRGSVDIDSALQKDQPQANRWDFAVGYQHANQGAEFVYWIETHTGSDNQIKAVLKKFEWLKEWLKGDGKELAKFDKRFVWIPSGPTSFTKGSRQVRQLSEKGLFYSGSVFQIDRNQKMPKA